MKKKILKVAFATMLASCALVSLPACKKKNSGNNNPPVVDPTDIDITGVSLNSQEFIYDGTAKTIQVTGNIPSGVSVTYSYKNSSSEAVSSCIEAGVYAVTATLSGSGYNTLTLNATLTIKAKELITGVILEAASVDYDGTAKTIQVTGTIPTGCSVAYSYKKGETPVNQCVTPGEYTVIATVTGEGYEDLVLTAVLTINKIEITGLVFEDQSVLYDGLEHTYSVESTADYTLSVEGYYSDSELTTKVTSVKSAGDYYVKIIAEGDNYLPTEYSSKLSIVKNENSAHDVLFTYSEGNEIYTYTLVVPANGTIAYSDISDYLNTLPDPGDEYDYYWVNYDGEEITSDLTISINKQAISYEIKFVDSTGNKLDSYRLTPYSDLIFPTIKIGDKYVLTWEYEGDKYFTGSGVRYNDSEDKVIVACDLMSEEENNLFDYSLEDGCFAITKYNGNEENVLLPTLAFKLYLGNITAYSVKRVMNSAFAGCDFIKTIEIPSGYDKFDDNAFSDVINLMSITLPEITENTVVGDDLFSGDLRLIEYVYRNETNPLSEEFHFGYIYYNALFARNINDESNIKLESDCIYYVYEGVTYLYEFLNSNESKNVVMPSKLGGNNYTIMENAMPDNIEKLTIADDTTIACTFETYGLTEVVVGDNVIFEYFEGVFAECMSLETITFGQGFTVLYLYMLYGCSNLTTINIKDVLESVEDGALLDCGSVTINFAHSESDINPTISDVDNDDYINATKNYNVSI